MLPPFDLKHEKFPKTEPIRSHNSRASKPSSLNPVSKEIISDSVELWETDVCFLHIQLIGTNVSLPKTHNVPPEVDFESSRSPAKSESWNSPNLHCLAVFPTWQYCLHSLVWWKYEINRFRRLSQALVHFVMALVIFGLPRRLTRPLFVGGPKSDHLSTRRRLLLVEVTFLGPIRFPQHLFSVHDHGRQRSGWGPQQTFLPYVGLTVHWAVSVRKSTTGRIPSR